MVKRKIKVPKDYLGSWEAYPTTYVMFVGPPGVVRKTTTAGYVEELLKHMNKKIVAATDQGKVHMGPSAASRAKLVEKLSETPDGSMAVIAGEFGNLVSVSPEEMYDLLSRLFDNPLDYTYSTRSHGDEQAINPSFNLLGCTTPDWIAENSSYMTGGGFAARTVFIFENVPRQRRLFYHNAGMDFEEITKIGQALVKDLITIGRLRGDFKFESKELEHEIEKWYQKMENFQGEKGTETFQARKHVHVLRTAMLLSVAERNDLVITQTHFNASKVLMEDVEKKMSRGLAVIGKNPHSAAYYKVLDYIEAYGPVDRGKILAHFWSDMRPEEVGQVLEVLQAAKEIELIQAGSNISVRKKK